MVTDDITSSTTTATAQNLRRLCALRNATLIGLVVAILLSHYWLKLTLPLQELSATLLLIALLNVATYWRMRQVWVVKEPELFAQLTLDVAMLTVVLYLSGGSTNPFVMLYLVPLALTAASLPQRYTWSMAALTTLCYGILMFKSRPLALGMHHHDDAFSLHIVGMWFGFVLSAIWIAWFGVRMAQALRDRDAMLARRREQELKQERVVALGALAAGAAHELGTPLATLAIVAGDLEPEKPLPSQSLQVLRDQIARCKHILNSLAASAGAVRAIGGGKQALDEFIKDIVKVWQVSRPQANLVRAEYHGSIPVPEILTEQTLAQAITNLLNNAADASRQHVELECRWTPETLLLEIADRGAGLSPEVAQLAGESFVTSQSGGLGLGLFLTFSTLERLGGEVSLFNRDGGGAVCRLSMPLTAIMVNA